MKLSRSKAFLFSTFPTIVLLLLLIVIEIILRLASTSDTSLFTPKTINGKEWLEVNRSYLKKYFPPSSPLIPELKPALIRKQKLPQTIRIFCLGESSMFGVPYNMAANIPAILRKQLRRLYPEKDLEVLNLGASAINTNVILDLSKELVTYQPDVVLIYTGHNEFYGPESVGAGWLQRTFNWAIPLTYRLRELKLAQWLASTIGGSRSEQFQELNLMKQVSQGSQVELESSEARRIFVLFESNLQAIVDRFKEHGVSVIVSDVSSNLEFPPFVSSSSGPDSSRAQYQFNLGQSLLKQKRTQEALLWFRKARDLDLLKFRAPTEINLIIRRVCSEQGIHFVSSDSLLTSKSEDGIPGEEYFWEHLHLNARGYYEIAGLFLEKMLQEHIPPFANSRPVQNSPIAYDLDSLSIPWLDLAYGDLSMRALTSKWPFNNYKRPAWVLDSANASLQNIVLAAYNRTMMWDEACLKSAEEFWKKGNTKSAVTTYEALLEEFEENFYIHYLLGNLLSKSANVEKAITHLQRSIQLKSDYPNARLDLGLMEINRGNFDAAIALLTEALKSTDKPEFRSLRANVYYGLAAAYANKGDFPRAMASADEALKLIPTYRDALNLKASIQQHDLR